MNTNRDQKMRTEGDGADVASLAVAPAVSGIRAPLLARISVNQRLKLYDDRMGEDETTNFH